MRLLNLTLAVSLMMGVGACKKKDKVAEDLLPDAPDAASVAPPPPPPPPTCDKREALVGEWYLTIKVADNVNGPIKGMNAFYRITAFPEPDPCKSKINVTLEGWGRGQIKYEKGYTGQTIVAEPEGDTWHIPLHYGIGEGAAEETEMVVRFKQFNNRLEGIWFYTGAAWTRSPLWGAMIGGKERKIADFEPPIGALMALDKCGVAKLDMATAETCK